jgi:hypothetical protein
LAELKILFDPSNLVLVLLESVAIHAEVTEKKFFWKTVFGVGKRLCEFSNSFAGKDFCVVVTHATGIVTAARVSQTSRTLKRL